MPTLGNIQNQIAMYLKKSLVDFDVTGDAGQNLVLTALNNARKHAEKVHDFSICRQRGYFSFASKTAWDSPTWYDGATEKLRKGKLWDLRTEGAIATEFDGTNIPLRMVRGDTKHQLESRRAYDAAVSDFERRALPDSTLLFDHPFLNQVYLMTRGKWLEYYPYSAETKNIMVDGYRWWPDWTINYATAAGYTRVWQFNAITDIDMEGATVQAFHFDYMPDGTNRAAVTVIKSSASPSAGAYLVNNPGEAATIPATFQRANIVAEFNKFLDTGSAVVSGAGNSIVTVTATGTNPTLDVQTLSTPGAYAATHSPTLISSVATTATTAPSSVEDWWTTNASEYLLWRALVECNHLGHVFTANREANLPSPDKKADLALALLIQNDQDAENPGEIQQY